MPLAQSKRFDWLGRLYHAHFGVSIGQVHKPPVEVAWHH